MPIWGNGEVSFSDLRNVIERASARETVGNAWQEQWLRFSPSLWSKGGGFVEVSEKLSAQEEMSWEEKISRQNLLPYI